MLNIKTTLAALALSFSMLMAQPAFAEDAPMSVSGSELATPAQAKALFDKGSAFLDVRDDAAWNQGRIPGAVHLDVKMPAFTKEAIAAAGVAADKDVVIYCNGVKCLRSAEAIGKMKGFGYTKMHYLREGFPGWKDAGYPVE